MAEKTASDFEPKGELYADTMTPAAEDLFEEGSVDPVYQAKARVLNAAIQEIGMGKYQVSHKFDRFKSCSLIFGASGTYSLSRALGGFREYYKCFAALVRS